MKYSNSAQYLQHMVKILLVVIGAFAFSSTSYAQSAAPAVASDKTGLYFGGSYGGFKSRGGDFDDKNDYLEGVVGVRLLPFLGLEGSYTNFGEFGGDVASAEVDGLGWAVVGYLPLSDRFDVFAKAGRFYSDVEVQTPGFSDEIEDDQAFYGLGLNYVLNDPLTLTVEYDRYKVGNDSDWPAPAGESDTDIDTLKLGLKLTF